MGNPSGPYPGEAPAPAPGFSPGFVSPPPPAYSTTGMQQQTVTMVQTPLVVGPEPTRLTCPHCQSTVTTNVKYDSNTRTHLMALLLCLVCPFGCCFIPYCMDSCMQASHTCPNCQMFLGTFTR